MSRSFTNISAGQRPINSRQAADLRQAKALKSEMMKAANRFEKFDGKAADKDGMDGAVYVPQETAMPKSMGKALMSFAFGTKMVPKEEDMTGSGILSKKDGEITGFDIDVKNKAGEAKEFRYSKTSDGTEVYHGKTADGGFMMVRENKAKGTLFIATDQEDMHRSFGSLEQSDFVAPNDSDDAPAADPAPSRPSGITRGRSPLLMMEPQTFGAVDAVVSSGQAEKSTEVKDTKSVGGAPNITVATGDLTQIEADAVMAPINSKGAWSGAIDDAITRAGGGQFHQQAADKLGHLNDGDSLVARKKEDHQGKFDDVVFVVDDFQKPLNELVTDGLRAAEKAGMKSIAIPTMRMGLVGSLASPDSSAKKLDQLAQGVKDFYADGESHTLNDITLTAYRDEASAGFLRERLA